jgi:hypothetical protein
MVTLIKKIGLAITFTALSLSAIAQETYNSSGKTGTARYKENQKKKGFDMDRMVFGGNLGLAFGNITNIYIAPIVGYRITDNLAAGISLGFNYYRQSNAYQSYNLNTGQVKNMPFVQTVYSGGLWAKYALFNNFLLQAEFEVNNILDQYKGYSVVQDSEGWSKYQFSRTTVPSLLLGGGYRQPIGEWGSMYIIAMYDVLQRLPSNMRDYQNQKVSVSPYANRIDLRVGFTIGF